MLPNWLPAEFEVNARSTAPSEADLRRLEASSARPGLRTAVGRILVRTGIWFDHRSAEALRYESDAEQPAVQAVVE